ncbi:nitroreductase family protein [Spongiimicrobium salis]|uniref:nitroreductase family protein n=1 Tax=Spongiimicrobium salis TaxID=1667022 RepID=UPI00374CEFBB
MDTIEYLEWRYAVKKFDAAKILPASALDRLKKAFNLTATSYGLQPIKLVVIQNKALQEQLVPHSYHQQQVAQASHLLVICINKTIDEPYINTYFERVKQLRNTSDEILDPFKASLVKSFSAKTEEEIKQWAINQAYLALGNLLTVCAVEKIDACPMEGFVPAAYDQALGLEAYDLNAVLALPIGYRAADDMFADFKKVRKTMEESILELS